MRVPTRFLHGCAMDILLQAFADRSTHAVPVHDKFALNRNGPIRDLEEEAARQASCEKTWLIGQAPNGKQPCWTSQIWAISTANELKGLIKSLTPSVHSWAPTIPNPITILNTAITRQQIQRKRNTFTEIGKIPSLSLLWNCNNSSLDVKKSDGQPTFHGVWYRFHVNSLQTKKKRNSANEALLSTRQC